MQQAKNLELQGDVRQLIKGELLGTLNPHAPGPRPCVCTSELAVSTLGHIGSITVTLLAERSHQSAWSAKAFYFYFLT